MATLLRDIITIPPHVSKGDFVLLLLTERAPPLRE
jgi:hypothetical protein